MARRGESDPVEIMRIQEVRRRTKLIRWVSPVRAALESKGGASVGVVNKEQAEKLVEGLTYRPEDATRTQKRSVKTISGPDTITGPHDKRTDTIASKLISFEMKHDSDGLIVVEGVDILGSTQRTGGNPHIVRFLSELALWKRTEHPKTLSRMPVLAIGILAMDEEMHISGNEVRRPNFGESFTDVFDAHFIIRENDKIEPLTFVATDPRTAGFGLSYLPSLGTGLQDVAGEVAGSRVENQLP